MALPTVAINSAGSNTAASGAGPATALFGTAAATAASTLVTLLVDNPNLSGVATDGSAVIWIGSSSGRQFSKITAVDNTAGVKTVTVAVAFANTESGKNWGIGGKRATIAGSLHLFIEAAAGWTIDIQTGETITAEIPCNIVATSALPLLITSTAGTRPLITTATNSINMWNISTSAFLIFRHLSLSNTAGTKGTDSANGRAFVPSGATATSLYIDDCIMDGFEVAIDADNINPFQIAFGLTLTNCEIKNSVLDGIRQLNAMVVDHCFIHNNGDNGIERPTAASTTGVSITNSVFTNNTGRGYQEKNTSTNGSIFTFVGNTFRNNTSTDLELLCTLEILVLVDNIFWGTGPYGVNAASMPSVYAGHNNGYGGPHSTAERNNIAAAPGDFALTVDPGNSSTDSGLNSTAGGGAAAKGAAAQAPNASANTAGDVGAIPSGGGVAAGGGIVRGRIFTGM
jgi:hypothetical protein